jgi:signal transduction histidine kinase
VNSAVANIILQQRLLAYAITDGQFNIVESAGDPFLLYGVAGQDSRDFVGQSLTAAVQELVGSEPDLKAILAGEQENLRFDLVNRAAADGQMEYVTLTVWPHRNAAGNITGLICLVENVTSQGRLRQELTQRLNDLRLLKRDLDRRNLDLAAANSELRLMSDIKSSFVSVAAHELRTPLTAIYGYLELLMDDVIGELSPEQREYLGTMQTSTERMLSTISNLLDVIRIDSDRVELVLQPVDFTEVLENVVVRFEPQILAKQQTLNLQVADDLPEALCDPVRAEQVVGHLLSNASKYSPPGGEITISVDLLPEGDYLHVAVADAGEGIASEDRQRIFTRFYRSRQATKEGKAGVGLGLYIVRSIVELHGGQVWYESEPGRGSVFHATFPVADTELVS